MRGQTTTRSRPPAISSLSMPVAMTTRPISMVNVMHPAMAARFRADGNVIAVGPVDPSCDVDPLRDLVSDPLGGSRG
jgi:hypothetical protein